MPKCRICETTYEAFMSFGNMPIANGFLKSEDFGNEYVYELKVGFCPRCAMVQILEQPERERMFHENYAYFSSISTRMAAHFQNFANMIMRQYLGEANPFVVEIGSNDGIMLRHFADAGIRHLGVDPSANVAQAAREKGIETLCGFFDEKLAEDIKAEYGRADVILAANVMCHIPYLHSVAAGVATLLNTKGVLVFEDPYLGDIIEKTSYDQIYDEHAFYFSLASIEYLFSEHGMEVVDIMPQNVHGGSMRYVIARKGVRPVSPAVAAQNSKEKALGLKSRATFDLFRKNVEHSRTELVNILESLRQQGKRVVGYGATSKSTTVTNYCGITQALVEFISDTTPTKQGKYSPGVHIPVRDYRKFYENHPDVALLFAWNHAEEIMAKEEKFRQSGGKWLTYVPRVEVID